VIDGRPLPTGGNAVWQLSGGPFHYAHIDIPANGIDYNIAPSDASFQRKMSQLPMPLRGAAVGRENDEPTAAGSSFSNQVCTATAQRPKNHEVA
jgi:hypothetical protein